MGLRRPALYRVGYLNGAVRIYSRDRSAFADARVTDIDYLQQALIPMSSKTYSGSDMAVCADGRWGHLFDGTIEQDVTSTQPESYVTLRSGPFRGHVFRSIP